MTCTLHHSDYSVLSKEVIFILDLSFIKTIIIQTPKSKWVFALITIYQNHKNKIFKTDWFNKLVLMFSANWKNMS